MNTPELQNEEVRKRSFLEDEKYENGSYQCMCIFCNKMFIGYKRRVCCKICEEPKGEENETN